MKKITTLFLNICMIIFLFACASNAEGVNNVSLQTSSALNATLENNQTVRNNKTLITYFSCTGNTKSVALKLSELIPADVYEIKPLEEYSDDDLNYNNSNCRANREMNDDNSRPYINGEDIDISKYDTIFIGYPIWWGTMPRIIDTFLDKYDLSGKKIMPFCTSGGSGVSRSVNDIKTFEPKADVRNGLKINGVNDQNISKWLSDNSIN